MYSFIDEAGNGDRTDKLLPLGVVVTETEEGVVGEPDGEQAFREEIRAGLSAWSRLALSSQGLTPAPHHMRMIDELEAVASGEEDRLMLLLPPGSAKSTYAFQDNWTGTDFLVPQASVVEWEGTWGGWQAISFPLADYVSPSGDGGLVVRSALGDVVMRPAGSGHLRVSSDSEPIGYSVLIGRGSPEGLAIAPPGSDYRNLDGGIGSTLWVKRSGLGATGWSAVA